MATGVDYGSPRWWIDQFALCLLGGISLANAYTALAWADPAWPPVGSEISPATWFGETLLAFFFFGVPSVAVALAVVAILRRVLLRGPSQLRRPAAVLLFGAALGIPTALFLATVGPSGNIPALTILGASLGAGIWLAVGITFRIPDQSPLPRAVFAAGVGLTLGFLMPAIPWLSAVAAAGAWWLTVRQEPMAGGILLVTTAIWWTLLLTPEIADGAPIETYAIVVICWIAIVAGLTLLGVGLIGPDNARSTSS